jgi:hypothetical protein
MTIIEELKKQGIQTDGLTDAELIYLYIRSLSKIIEVKRIEDLDDTFMYDPNPLIQFCPDCGKELYWKNKMSSSCYEYDEEYWYSCCDCDHEERIVCVIKEEAQS